MHDTISASASRCRETGLLLGKDQCYAIRRGDGTELWLEMDRIPFHLIDQLVVVQGTRHANNLISVDGIGPA